MLRYFMSIVGVVSICFACGTTAYGQLDNSAADIVELPAETSTVPPDATGEERAREGTQLLRQLGRFTTTGDRLTFHVAGSDRQYLGLENLALERIGKVLVDRRDQASELQWEVTGMFTEYRGTNYLLVTRALLKSKNLRGSTAITSSAR